MELLSSPANPAPPGAELASVTTADAVTLRAARWAAPAGHAKGTVLILQGRAEFIEKYFETIGELLTRGFSVVAFDWRGQGGSDRALADGHRGHVRHFEDFRLDYEAVAAHFRLPDGFGPLYALAHSMGGCIALTGASEGWLKVDRLVALAPMLGLSLVRQTGLVRPLMLVLDRLGFRTRFVPGGISRSISTLPFPGNRLCRDEARYARNAALATALGSGAIGSPTVGWLNAAYEAMARLARPGAAATIRVPTLVVAAGDDPVCSTPAIELFARAMTSGTIVTIPKARHEILMETDEIRAAFWQAFDRFVARPTQAVEGRPAVNLPQLS